MCVTAEKPWRCVRPIALSVLIRRQIVFPVQPANHTVTHGVIARVCAIPEPARHAVPAQQLPATEIGFVIMVRQMPLVRLTAIPPAEPPPAMAMELARRTSQRLRVRLTAAVVLLPVPPRHPDVIPVQPAKRTITNGAIRLICAIHKRARHVIPPPQLVATTTVSAMDTKARRCVRLIAGAVAV